MRNKNKQTKYLLDGLIGVCLSRSGRLGFLTASWTCSDGLCDRFGSCLGRCLTSCNHPLDTSCVGLGDDRVWPCGRWRTSLTFARRWQNFGRIRSCSPRHQRSPFRSSWTFSVWLEHWGRSSGFLWRTCGKQKYVNLQMITVNVLNM